MLYHELFPKKKLPWIDVYTVARQMLPFELALIRKAILMTHTNNVRNFVAYWLKTIADWNARGVRTYKDFCDGVGMSNGTMRAAKSTEDLSPVC